MKEYILKPITTPTTVALTPNPDKPTVVRIIPPRQPLPTAVIDPAKAFKNRVGGISFMITPLFARQPCGVPILVGLLEISRKGDTNHLGLLILDEPRQQSADKVSFAALLKRVANSSNQQVIFATSEDEETLKTMLKDLPHGLKPLPKRMLEPIPKKI
jgi:hypothetical protein